jgi:flagellar motor switch protein FliN/FliY
MTEDKPASTPDAPHGFRWLIAEWAHALAQAIEGMGGPSLGAEVAEAGDQPGAEGSFWWAQELSLAHGHSIWIGAAASSWREIGGGALQALGIETPEAGEIRDTYREIVAQSLSSLASALTARCHKEVTCQAGEPLVGPPETGARGFINLRRSGAPPFQLCFVARAELLKQLDPETPAQASSEKAAENKTGKRERTEQTAVAIGPVLNLEMPVCVSLGIGRISLEETFKLTRGSLIPLSQRADDPVEFRVNGKLVARGEVVTVNGQYGIRVQELISRSERLDQVRSL